ncbi:hypothetical protein EJ03DRAFT_351278 [Teratosphaeria nubilosa]|uniref:Uncharacterized protein n=1 Tax=Teratosphaeria nubilosa TaxID=161662 RepID=A0A6G1L9J6_9PEZI|nr:hypothetical protein EJ03DRAFT_351278 [Teratosphaeria nubilosa]
MSTASSWQLTSAVSATHLASLSSRRSKPKTQTGYSRATTCTASPTDDDEALCRILRFLTDITVFAPTVHHATAFTSEGITMYVYRFNELKPWDGPWEAHSTLALDITLLLQNFNEHLEGSERQFGQHFAEDVVTFVYGESPWWPQQDGAEKLARVYGPSGRFEDVPDVPAQVGRRKAILDLAETVAGGMDKLKSVADAFLLAS